MTENMERFLELVSKNDSLKSNRADLSKVSPSQFPCIENEILTSQLKTVHKPASEAAAAVSWVSYLHMVLSGLPAHTVLLLF